MASDPTIESLTKELANVSLDQQFATSATDVAGDDAQVYNYPMDRTFPSFEPMVDDESFLIEEYNAPIALLNNNYWQTQKSLDEYKTIKERTQKWFEATGCTDERLKQIETTFTKNIETLIADPKAQFERIFIRDAERCFNGPKRRTLLCHVLTYLQNVTLQGDYHQGLSMMCTFLLCFLSAPKVIAMAIHANEKLLPGVWKSRSDAMAIDGYVLFNMLETSPNEKHQNLYHHFKKVYIIPEMFVSKYWCGLAVHLLPFQSIVEFFDNFWCKNGVLALYECIFIVLFGQYDAIMKTSTTDKTLELIALDHKVLTPTFVNELTYCYPNGTIPEYVTDAQELVQQLESIDVLKSCRNDAFKTHIEPRIQRSADDFAKITAKQPDCQREACEDKTESGYYFCLDCKIHLCEACGYSSWDDHNDDDHEVRMNEDLDE